MGCKGADGFVIVDGDAAGTELPSGIACIKKGAKTETALAVAMTLEVTVEAAEKLCDDLDSLGTVCKDTVGADCKVDEAAMNAPGGSCDLGDGDESRQLAHSGERRRMDGHEINFVVHFLVADSGDVQATLEKLADNDSDLVAAFAEAVTAEFDIEVAILSVSEPKTVVVEATPEPAGEDSDSEDDDSIPAIIIVVVVIVVIIVLGGAYKFLKK